MAQKRTDEQLEQRVEALGKVVLKAGQDEEELSTARAEAKNTVAHILLVEDDIISRDFALSLLETLGYRVDAIDSGEEAVKILKSVPYRMVLMDVQMPGMDGYEATRIIRDPTSDVLNHDIPIVAMTAHTMEGDRERCLEKGMDDYVSKPIELERFVGVIERHLGKSRLNEPESTVKKAMPGDEDFVGNDLPSRFGCEVLLRRLVELFLGKIPLQIEALKQALEVNDACVIEELGHTIKGGAALIEADSLSGCASEIEKAGKSRDLNMARRLVDKLAREYEKLSEGPDF